MNKVSHKQTVIFISNRFGYGPTVTLFHVIRSLMNNARANYVFAGSGICKEVFDGAGCHDVAFEELDERDEGLIRSYLEKMRFSYGDIKVVSSLNKLAVRASQSLGIPCALVDCLAWMWNIIPDGYKSADLYFANCLATPPKSFMIKTPLILGPITYSTCPKDVLLINLGGVENYHYSALPEDYLSLLCSLLDSVSVPAGKKVIVTGGRKITEFIEPRLHRRDFDVRSLDQKSFNEALDRSYKVLTLAGMNTVFTSFAKKIPVGFLLPMVYSQWRLSAVLQDGGYRISAKHWDDYMDIPGDYRLMTEKDSISFVESLAKRASGDPMVFGKMSKDLQFLIDADIDIVDQDRCIVDFGINGESFVVSRLKEEWGI